MEAYTLACLCDMFTSYGEHRSISSSICHVRDCRRLPARMMPPLPAFLSNLQRQNPAAPGSYGTITTTSSALAGSPAQYLQSRQPHQNTPGGHSSEHGLDLVVISALAFQGCRCSNFARQRQAWSCTCAVPECHCAWYDVDMRA